MRPFTHLPLLLLVPLLLPLATGCPTKEDTGVDVPDEVDQDQDGAPATEDCDDLDPRAYPGNPEVCDDVDNDCDAEVDEEATDAGTWYQDADGDGYGNDAASVIACDLPTGYLARGGDCDDANADFHPGAPEDDCTDPNDYDCDGVTLWADADADGWAACLDCDDANAEANPDAEERCNDFDDDCDGNVDESNAVDAKTWYYDRDGDGYGADDAYTRACARQPDTVNVAGDCDDGNAFVNPDGVERCNSIDDDCDGTVDGPTAVDALTWYPDLDGDEYGDGASPVPECEAPVDHVLRGTDCDDTDPSAYPDAPESCDAVDDDCDGTVDEDPTDGPTWYADADADGYGDADTPVVACSQPTGYVEDLTDCDDADATVNPAATEVDCDAIDQDCDGAGYVGAPTGDDLDGDLWSACDDCDDWDPSVNPVAEETCDEIDNNCNGTIDTDADSASTWYLDADGDGYGDPDSALVACEAPTAYVSDGTDCDDTKARVYPGRGCYTPAYIWWEFYYGQMSGAMADTTFTGMTLSPTMLMYVASEELLDAWDTTYLCTFTYDMTASAGSLGSSDWFEWQVDSLSLVGYEGTYCDVMGAADIATEYTSSISYAFTLDEADADTTTVLEDGFGTDWASYAPYIYSGELYIDGVGVGMQTFYGFTYAVDASGEVDTATMLPVADVEAGSDGYYNVMSLYLFSL